MQEGCRESFAGAWTALRVPKGNVPVTIAPELGRHFGALVSLLLTKLDEKGVPPMAQ